MFKDFNPKESEKEILEFWQNKKIFEKSVGQKAPKGDFVFYDGPPFATGLPHCGHILISIIKDAMARYRTMQGFRVERRWGWDCHGLPIENLIEQELGLKTKKDIEKFGIDQFNEKAQASVLRYADEWKKIIARIGRWVDMGNDYKTMDWSYTESVWWVFKELYDKKLVYQGYKAMHLCPRCETILANFEVTLNYKDIVDLSVIAKFELIDDANLGLAHLDAFQGETEHRSESYHTIRRARGEGFNEEMRQIHKSYLLAWTTTPWTLPGNVALAVNPEIKYVKIKLKAKSEKLKDEYYVLAKARLEMIKQDYEVTETFKGCDLVGKKYEPIFDYYQNQDNVLENNQNGWQIYPAEFVSAQEGTGVVHIAPAFGEEDFNLGIKSGLPFIQPIDLSGHFKKEVRDFVGLPVKPQGNHQVTDKEIITKLSLENKIFEVIELSHSYPHCWRCDTPLLNYTSNSWFVKVSSFKDKLIAINKKINWVPNHIKDGRFGKWLAEARDWAISRSRFWGAPLPVWQCQKCPAIKVIGSLKELRKNARKSGNHYFVMRHGQAEHQILGVTGSSDPNVFPLTPKGKKQAEQSVKELKSLLLKNKIDLIFASPLSRTRETAEIISQKLKVEKINLDERIREIDFGDLQNRSIDDYHHYFSSPPEYFTKRMPQGENFTDVKTRAMDFILDLEKSYQDKNILIVSHSNVLWLLTSAIEGLNNVQIMEMNQTRKKGRHDDYMENCEIRPLSAPSLSYNQMGELDLHRPYIDQVKIDCRCGGEMRRVKEVFDCWFESGSMPYGQSHYPFENKKKWEKNFPAQFISEALDQTRGWFYSLLVLSTALFKKIAFKNVVVSGMIMAADGKKLSKRLKNYSDPMTIVENYGADALRCYLLSSPVVYGENLNFSDQGVNEIYKKIILRLNNVFNFYKLYQDTGPTPNAQRPTPNASKKIANFTIIDQWILARLDSLNREIVQAMENYCLDQAVRPIGDFVDDLSTWYLRRSRDRFKEEGEEKKQAILMMELVLGNLAKMMAPFLPFLSEYLYSEVDGRQESVHLERWPELRIKNKELRIKNNKSQNLIKAMGEIRKLASLALEARSKLGIKVRQPLAKLKIRDQQLKGQRELLQILAEEVNVKEIEFDPEIDNEVWLDQVITQDLKEEGLMREFVRLVQEMRKDGQLKPQDSIDLSYSGDFEIPEHFNLFLKNKLKAKKIQKGIGAKEVFLVTKEILLDGTHKILVGIKN